ncbi:sarcosine oxidase subunit gamma [Aurantimonas marina]|uniref:sarcosine oxidase subunit gamma n=1 Tax=Aurantimonas marina TaxID=2780508 RepID=UPI0019CF9F81|nr:sarcosine oxidase subunit gamma [Aurantimonas marina]
MAGTNLPRMSPLDGRYASGPGVTLTPLAPRQRISLRADAQSLEAVEAKLGLALPMRPKTSTSEGDISALWIGPDEWLMVSNDDAGGAESLPARLAGVPGISAVDVSHRNVAIAVEGPAAEAVIAAGCPQDIRLGGFPVGAASRTILSKAEIVLWRTGEQRFEVECWRSFADYVWTFLAEAARSPAV